VSGVSERWIEKCRTALESIKKMSSIEGKDRLELVKSIQTSLGYVGKSLSGWTSWVNNPSAIAIFSKEELEEMDKHLSNFAESFIEYDLETTKLGLEKGLSRKKAADRKPIRFII